MSGDRTPWVIGLLLTAVAGPLGAAGGLLIAVLEWRAAQSQSLLEDWYAWMSGTTGVDSAAVAYEAIVTGRSVRTGSVHARRFAEVIRSGALPEKQAVLGLVGLKYHRDYLPVLQLALRSPQASVRAQAAAVFVKLKERFRGELSRLIAARVGIVGAASARGALADARLVLDCCRSGFIDAAEAREALRMAAGWCDEIAAGTELSDAAEMLACELLAAAGDHEALASRVPRDRTGVAGGARVLLAQSLMMLGRTRELHALLANGGVAAPARASSQPA